MQCKEIMQVIEATYPRTAALDFDNVGLLAGRADKEVNRVYLALDATDRVIERAIEAGADMLITHHPLLFSAVKKVTDEDFITRTGDGRAGRKSVGHCPYGCTGCDAD